MRERKRKTTRKRTRRAGTGNEIIDFLQRPKVKTFLQNPSTKNFFGIIFDALKPAVIKALAIREVKQWGNFKHKQLTGIKPALLLPACNCRVCGLERLCIAEFGYTFSVRDTFFRYEDGTDYYYENLKRFYFRYHSECMQRIRKELK